MGVVFTEDRLEQMNYIYDLTPTQVEKLLDYQQHACAICHIPFNDIATRNIHVDHQRKPRKVRGILCRSCNVRLRVKFCTYLLSLQHGGSEWECRAITYLRYPPTSRFDLTQYE